MSAVEKRLALKKLLVLTALLERRKRQKQKYMEDFGSGGLFEEQNKRDNF